MPQKKSRHSLTRDKYSNNWQKFSQKRPKFTAEEFHAADNQCEVCGNKHFLAERQMEPSQKHYRIWGYQTRRIQWRIKCITKNCNEPLGVILKSEYWDSAE